MIAIPDPATGIVGVGLLLGAAGLFIWESYETMYSEDTKGADKNIGETKGESKVNEKKRKSSRKIRKEWEAEHGQWPKDAETGRNMDVSHEVPKADRETDDISNIKPRPRKEHIERHKKAGDFKRWGKRRRP